ncbi:MAG: arylamine N-acetyltransferase family protein [Coriobacteriales bacterium]|jgi:N-hydroxyarylamine O-acetyltransferase
MFEEYYEPVPDLDSYLSRIGMARRNPSADYLDELIFMHQCKVPFEDLDPHEKHKCVSLGIRDLFDKVVMRKRGGFCFELNAIFGALLRVLGFEVQPSMARVLMFPMPYAPCTHRVNIVTIDGERYLADVGFGGPEPAFALKLEEGFERTGHGQTFAIAKHDDYWWDLLYDSSKGRINPLRFATVPSEETDFIALSYYQSANPESHFVNTRIVNLRTPNGNLEITGSEFTRREGSEVSKIQIESDEQLDELLSKWFGIENWR